MNYEHINRLIERIRSDLTELEREVFAAGLRYPEKAKWDTEEDDDEVTVEYKGRPD